MKDGTPIEVLVNVAGWTSDITDETKFVSVFLNSSLWPTRSDIFCVNDGYEPRLGRTVESYMTLLNSTSVGNTSSEFAAFIQQEQARWKPVIARAQIKPEGA